MEDVAKYIKKTVKSLINENIKLINEKWSISEEVDELFEKLINDIQKDVLNANIEKIDDGLLFYSNEITNYIILNRNIKINYYIYNCASDTICDFIYNEAEKLNGFQEDENILNITLYMVKGVWRNDYNERNIIHELEHILQINYGFTKNKNYKKLMDNAYNYANFVLRNQQQYSRIELIVAWLVYYSNSHEQDAFIQEYARELKRNLSILYTKKSETHKILRKYEEYCEYFENYKDTPYIINSVKQYKLFGYNFSNFEKMITKQLMRFKRKMKNVEKNFNNEIKSMKHEDVVL